MEEQRKRACLPPEPRIRLIASRAGVYPPGVVPQLLREGRVIEFWVHALSVLPAEDWPLFAWARERMRDGTPWHGDVRTRYPGLAERVLAEIRERGALGSRDFAGERDPSPHRVGTSSEKMWSWKPAKQMLDALFATGELVIADRVSFQRRYDLPERVLPGTVLDAPIPPENEAIKALVVKAVRARGALTEFAIAEHVRPIWGFLGGAKAARRTSTRSSPKGSSRGSPSTTAGRRSSSRQGSSWTDQDRVPPSSCRRSTTCSGATSSRRAYSASST